MSRRQVCAAMINSPEFSLLFDFLSGAEPLNVRLHDPRCDLVRQLPPAKDILDLGGANAESEEGSLLAMDLKNSLAQAAVEGSFRRLADRDLKHQVGPAQQVGRGRHRQGVIHGGHRITVASDAAALPQCLFDGGPPSQSPRPPRCGENRFRCLPGREGGDQKNREPRTASSMWSKKAIPGADVGLTLPVQVDRNVDGRLSGLALTVGLSVHDPP